MLHICNAYVRKSVARHWGCDSCVLRLEGPVGKTSSCGSHGYGLNLRQKCARQAGEAETLNAQRRETRGAFTMVAACGSGRANEPWSGGRTMSLSLLTGCLSEPQVKREPHVATRAPPHHPTRHIAIATSESLISSPRRAEHPHGPSRTTPTPSPRLPPRKVGQGEADGRAATLRRPGRTRGSCSRTPG